MSIPLVIAIGSAFCFGILAIFLWLKVDKEKKSIKDISHSEGVRDEFTHMMVHELRAPLTSIKDSSELLITSKASLREDEQEQFLKMINRQAKVLLEQISQILDTAKFESGTFSLYKRAESIQDIIYEKIKVFEPQAEKKTIVVSSHIDGPLPLINVDSLRIGQVINNLLSNSIKFTPVGGKISIHAKVSGENIEVSVSDTGLGIPKDQLEHIFTKFFQVKTTDRHEEKDGSGLGLYIVKKIIDAHDGKIWVDSETGKGTTFFFTIPVSQHLTEERHEDTPKASYTLPN